MIDFWKSVYQKKGLPIANFKPEQESQEYFANNVIFNGKNAKFRVAKTTPKKIGQFVTLWKRKNKGSIHPFDATDGIDFIIVAVQNGKKLGHFIFPKEVLCDKGIFTDKKAGKRAIRVYPPWNSAQNTQAIKTQKWQLEYFTDFSDF